MNKIQIKLITTDMVREFVRICSRYDCDVNLYDGKNIFDAKSIVSCLSIESGKELKVQAISSNEDVVVNFINDMKKFGV